MSVMNRLRRGWQALSQPLVKVDDSRRQQIISQSSLFLMGVILLIIIIPLTYFAGVPGSTFQTRALATLACIVIFFIGYLLSRYNRLHMAVVWMVFPASLVIIAVSISTGAYGYLTLFFLSTPTIISGLFASVRVSIALTLFNTLLIIGCKLMGLFDADVLISPLIFNITLACILVTTVEYRRRQLAAYHLRLQQSEARYRALFESVKDILFTLSADGIIETVNAAVMEIMGWTGHELAGKHFLTVFHPDDQTFVYNTFASIMNGSTPDRIEARLLTKSGSYRWVELSASAVQVEGLHGMSGVARDISGRKLAEAALQVSRQRFSLFIEQMPLALIEWDMHERIVAWNPAASRMFGFEAQQAVQLQGIDLLALEADKPRFKALLHNRTLKQWMSDHITHDDRRITCEWVSFPLVDDDGNVLGVAAMAEDITVRVGVQQQEMKLILTQERLNVLQHFLGSISHDFRTSLTQIETNRYLIERAITPSERAKIQPRLSNITIGIQHIVAQLENLSIISNVGDMSLMPHSLPLLVEQLVTLRQPAAKAKHIEVQYQCEHDLPPVMIDVAKLQIALNHLLLNAISFTPPHGRIALSVRRTHTEALVEISDTGQGISPEDMEHIFDLFFRADQARSVETGGIGVGLSIARLIIEAHGGSISVESQAGQGSTFTLHLPLSTQPLLAASG